MTEKQNALEIVRFGKPEKIVWHMPEYNLAYYGCNHESYGGLGDHSPAGTHWVDIWGTGWHKELDGVMGLPESYPLDEPEKLQDYIWPDPRDPRLIGQVFERRARFPEGADAFLNGRHRDTLWEKAYMLVGMENLMVYMHTEPDFAHEVFRRIMDFQMGVAEAYLACGVELVRLGDDLGAQHSLMISRAMIEEFLVPEYRRLIGLYKRHGVLVEFHSCGCVEDIVDLFIDLGVDILNPLQASANDLAKIRVLSDRKLCLRGGVSTELIASGTREEIEADVREKIWLLGQDAGYFCSPDQKIPWTDAQYRHFTDALDKYGRYPLRREINTNTQHSFVVAPDLFAPGGVAPSLK